MMVAALMALLALPMALLNAAAEAPTITCQELRRAQLNSQPVVLVDVRPASEYLAGHIQGALSIPGGEVGTEAVPRTGRVIVYCSEYPCQLTETAALRLKGMGYSDVVILQGGIGEWKKAGFPMTGAARPPSATHVEYLSLASARDRVASGQILVLDIRPRGEFAGGHLPTAQSAPLEDLAGMSIPKDRPVLVYDRREPRSARAADLLSKAGYQVHELPGGYAGWVKKGYMVEVK